MANMQSGKDKVSAPASQGDSGDFIEISVYEAKKWFRSLLSPASVAPHHQGY